MEPFVPNNPQRLEAEIQRKIILTLKGEDWFAKATFGNAYQTGFPDVYAHHIRYGPRWIEVKRPTGSRLEQSQVEIFGTLATKRVGVWILTSHQPSEMKKLFIPGGNYYQFLDIMKPVTRNRASKAKPYEPPKKLGSSGPERDIQEALKSALTEQGWFVMDTHGNTYSHGFPDMYAAHRDYGARWIEVKNPRGYKFTAAQMETFPLMEAHGSGVWLLTDVSEIPRLMGPSNWRDYLDRNRI